jgi:hypothetical protein
MPWMVFLTLVGVTVTVNLVIVFWLVVVLWLSASVNVRSLKEANYVRVSSRPKEIEGIQRQHASNQRQAAVETNLANGSGNRRSVQS